MLIPTPTSGEISLYFHLPFCHKKCDYCHFYVLPDKQSFKDLLLKSLLLELELKKKWLQGQRLHTIYFGGGTPALVGPQFIETILIKLSHFFSLNNIEITIEINPENNSLDLLKNFRQTGINRLSLGAQTFDDKLLEALNRSHNSLDIHKALEHAHQAGFENITCDLMYDLPNQTISNWQETLLQIDKHHLTHLSLYNLTIEPHTVFYKKRNEIQKKMPLSEQSLQMFEMAKTHFKKLGFEHYEISAFCKPGYYSKHNVGYWLERPHLGFGPSAFSLFNQRRFRNVANISKYSKQLEQNLDPADFEEILDPPSFLRESLALHLRLVEGFDLNIFEKRFGKLDLELTALLKKLLHEQMVENNQNILKLTPQGLLYHDEIASQIV